MYEFLTKPVFPDIPLAISFDKLKQQINSLHFKQGEAIHGRSKCIPALNKNTNLEKDVFSLFLM
jgi:hypothetical protein